MARYLAVFNVERNGGVFTKEEVIIEGDYNVLDPSDRELVEDNTELRDEHRIIYAELVGLRQLND
jgi:hypothetical protein